MPWKVKKNGDKYDIVKSDTGKVVGHSKTHEAAMASVRARYAAMKPKEKDMPMKKEMSKYRRYA